MLNGRLTLHEIDDVEAFCRRVVDAHLSSTRTHLRRDDADDLLAYTIELAWEISQRFDKTCGVSFSTYAYRLLRVRCVDWMRQRYGRTKWTFGDGTVHTRERPEALSLDAPDSDGDRLGDAIADSSSDNPASRAAAFSGLVDERGGSFARDLDEIRRALARHARRGDRGPMTSG